ncbi:MAG: SsrA-binding protein SmpB [Desulfobaccales bacterium]
MSQDDLKIICRNRKAYFEYAIDALYEAGMVLQGTEVKSLRQGRANIGDAFASFRGGEIFLYNAHISPYSHAGPESHNPERPRKLLMHRWEMRRLLGKLQERGYTLIPVRLYFRDQHAKVELALAKGKKKYDKRETIKRREQQREMDRARRRR